jgi:RNA recognition motif-containing protein
MESKVVLVCLKPYTSQGQITEQMLVAIFSEFASVTNISVFETTPIIKAFVEFESAQLAKNVTDHFNHRLFNIGSLRVYHSKKAHIKDKKKRKTPKQKAKDFEPTLCPRILPLANVPVFNNSLTPSFPNHPIQLPVRKSGNSNHTECSQFNEYPVVNSSGVPKPLFKPVNPPSPSGSFEDCPLAAEFNELLNFNQECLLAERGADPSNDSSRYLSIRNLNFKIVNHKVLMNLLCCFGNVVKIFTNQIQSYAIVEFSDINETLWAIHYLQNQYFFGKILKLTNSPKTNISLIKISITHNHYDIVYYKPQDFRYKSALNIKFNAPSPMLHITNLSDNCTPVILYKIICEVREPTKIIKLVSKPSQTTSMMLLEFDSVTTSLEVLSVLHNKVIDGKAVRVSFSQTKLDSYQKNPCVF